MEPMAGCSLGRRQKASLAVAEAFHLTSPWIPAVPVRRVDRLKRDGRREECCHTHTIIYEGTYCTSTMNAQTPLSCSFSILLLFSPPTSRGVKVVPFPPCMLFGVCLCVLFSFWLQSFCEVHQPRAAAD